MATAAVMGLAWWGLGRGRRDPVQTKADRSAPRFFGPAAETSSRTFGAPRPGARVAPPPPPRVCGAAYGASILYKFRDPAKPAPRKAGKTRKTVNKGMAKKTGPGPKPRPSHKGPEAVQHRHTFLLVGRKRGWTYVPLTFEIRITMRGREMTALKLDRTGGVLPDRRTRRPRRPRRLGYHDSLQPGLRISDLIGRVQADLVPDPAGGVKIIRQRLQNRLVSQWLQTGLGLANFLRPRSPRAGARHFEDRRLPPGHIAPGCKNLVRRFRLQPRKKSAATGTQITYRIDAPLLSMRRAKSTTPVRGQVSLTPGEPLPSKAELQLDKLPRKGGGTQTVTLRLDHLGQRCNDK